MSDIQEKIFNIYTLMELSYQKHFTGQYKNIDELYPLGWYQNKNYKIKIDIISEAILTNKLIVNTEKYQFFVEGDVKAYTRE